MTKYSKEAPDKVVAMRERKEGIFKLVSSKRGTSKKQAFVIGLWEARGKGNQSA